MSDEQQQVIEIAKEVPFLAGEKGETKIAKIVITPLRYADFVEATNVATRASSSYLKVMQRERRRVQCRALDAKGKAVKVSDADWYKLPIVYAGPLKRAMEMDYQTVAGEVIGGGDGVATPVLFRLGQPLTTGSDKAIEELEFSARTLGDIEDVLAEYNPPAQALMLVQKCAKPVGGDVQLLSLPSWALAELSYLDGFTIQDKVLPRFLG